MSNVLRLFCATLLGLLPQAVSAEEVTFYSAPYEVIGDDPFCNGPHERLVRMRLNVPNFIKPKETFDAECSIRTRRGSEMITTEIPCINQDGKPDNFPVIQGKDIEDFSITVKADLEVCQSIWHAKLTVKSGSLQFTHAGKTEVYGLESQFSGNRPMLSYYQQKNKMQPILISCPEVLGKVIYNGLALRNVTLHFDMFEKPLSECVDNSCFLVGQYEEINRLFNPFAILGCKDPTQ